MHNKIAFAASALIALSLTSIAWAGQVIPFSIKVHADNRASLLFTEKEPIKVKVRVEGGSGPIQIEYTVLETGGEWSSKGTLAIPRKGDGAVEAPLPLSLPGRGHYQLSLAGKCGELKANEFTTAAVIYPPSPTTVDSPWGIMYGVYRGYPSGMNPKDRPAHIAESLQMLGASWTRLNFWLHMYSVQVKDGNVVIDVSQVKQQVKEFRKRGINILGEIVQTPRVLSSKPNELGQKGDAGPLFCRVKPADYKLWDQMVEKIAREFKDDINVWEIWNEVDLPDNYWAGTTAEFLELLDHTATAIRKGNPNAKIAAAGFTPYLNRCAPFFEAGFGKNIDILSVHYTAKSDRIGDWLKLQEKYGLKLPIVNTEDSVVIPLNNLAYGIRTFKYIHMLDVQLTLLPLMTMDWKINPAAVTYSVGAHLIGAKQFRRMKEYPGFRAYFFGDDIAVITPYSSSVKLMDYMNISKIRVKTIPIKGREVVGIDNLGREQKLPDGAGEIRFSLMASMIQNRNMIFAAPECVFIRGCQDIVSIEKMPLANGAIVTEAESASSDDVDSGIISDKKECSGGKYVNIWKKTAPGKKGYGVDLKMNIPVSGDYVVFFSGNPVSRLTKPCSISPFSWSFDDGPPNQAGEKRHNILGCIEGAPEGLSELGTVHLTKGEHTFRLRLTAPREMHDNYWALWIDAIALVPVR